MEKKFHLIAKWTEANLPSERRIEEWIYNGKILWQLIPSQKQANWLKIKKFKKDRFEKCLPG